MSNGREIKSVHWDGQVLSGLVAIGGKLTEFTATQDFIHRHAPGFNDAVHWEIERHRLEIFEKLLPVLVAKEERS